MNAKTILTISAVSLCLGGCTDKVGDTGPTNTGGGGGGDGAPSATVTWGGSAVSVSISGSSTYWFGMAEDESTSDDPWTGDKLRDIAKTVSRDEVEVV